MELEALKASVSILSHKPIDLNLQTWSGSEKVLKLQRNNSVLCVCWVLGLF